MSPTTDPLPPHRKTWLVRKGRPCACDSEAGRLMCFANIIAYDFDILDLHRLYAFTLRTHNFQQNFSTWVTLLAIKLQLQPALAFKAMLGRWSRKRIYKELTSDTRQCQDSPA